MSDTDSELSEPDVNPHSVPIEGLAATPDRYQVAVLMQCLPVSNNRWVNSRWEVMSVIPARSGIKVDSNHPVKSDEGYPAALLESTQQDASLDKDHRIVRHDGLRIRLYPDESESYYHNLMMDDPRCFVVCREDDGTDVPVPMLVTASFDEANAYAEGDDRVESVSLPRSLHKPMESYVLTHYVPTKRIKRKRKNWKDRP